MNSSNCNSAHTTEHLPLFGGVVAINAFIFAVSVIIIVASVLLVEFTFETITEMLKESAFKDMFFAIQKELMTVGLMSFIFKIILNTTHFISGDWLIGLEYAGNIRILILLFFYLSFLIFMIPNDADVLIPVTSFMYCLQGTYLIILCIFRMELWSKSFHAPLQELLEDFCRKLDTDLGK